MLTNIIYFNPWLFCQKKIVFYYFNLKFLIISNAKLKYLSAIFKFLFSVHYLGADKNLTVLCRVDTYDLKSNGAIDSKPLGEKREPSLLLKGSHHLGRNPWLEQLCCVMTLQPSGFKETDLSELTAPFPSKAVITPSCTLQ